MRRVAGFTIIELLVVMAVAAVFLSLAAPGFADFVLRMRLGSSMSDLKSDLLLARSEAIRRNSRVVVCPRSSATSSACAASVAATTWMNGWLVCYDADGDGACDAASASDPNPVRIRTAPSEPLSLEGPAAAVTFFPVGNASSAASFSMSAGTSSSRSATVAPSGAVSSSKS